MSGPWLADRATWMLLSTELLYVTLRLYLLCDWSNPSTSTDCIVFCSCGEAPQNHSWRVCRPPTEPLEPEQADSASTPHARATPMIFIADLAMDQLFRSLVRIPLPPHGSVAMSTANPVVIGMDLSTIGPM